MSQDPRSWPEFRQYLDRQKSGGFCAPGDTVYDILATVPQMDWDYVDWGRACEAFATGVVPPVAAPVTLADCLPKITAARGGIRFSQPTLDLEEADEHEDNPGRARWWRARPRRRNP